MTLCSFFYTLENDNRYFELLRIPYELCDKRMLHPMAIP